jgi:hypothetical protein
MPETKTEPTRHIPLEGQANFRDLGIQDQELTAEDEAAIDAEAV